MVAAESCKPGHWFSARFLAAFVAKGWFDPADLANAPPSAAELRDLIFGAGGGKPQLFLVSAGLERLLVGAAPGNVGDRAPTVVADTNAPRAPRPEAQTGNHGMVAPPGAVNPDVLSAFLERFRENYESIRMATTLSAQLRTKPVGAGPTLLANTGGTAPCEETIISPQMSDGARGPTDSRLPPPAATAKDAATAPAPAPAATAAGAGAGAAARSKHPPAVLQSSPWPAPTPTCHDVVVVAPVLATPPLTPPPPPPPNGDSDDNWPVGGGGQQGALSHPALRATVHVGGNQAGPWDFFISHTQRSGLATTIASGLENDLTRQGYRCWLDVRMDDRSEFAMKDGVVRSGMVLAIITGPCENPTLPDDDRNANAYFARSYCTQELRWAREAGIPIQPVVSREDKCHIGDFIGAAPPDLKDIGGTDFITLDRSDHDYWELGVDKVVAAFLPFRPDRHQHRQHAKTVPDEIVPGLEGKHVMLSYHPSSQAEVVQLRDGLVAAGIPVWMSVGVAGTEVYDMIAQGVHSAVCVVVFMSQQFEDSENCKLELTFAHSTGCAVLPCMAAQEWRPSRWLAVATAELPITRLCDHATFEHGVAELVAHVRRVAGVPAATDGRTCVFNVGDNHAIPGETNGAAAAAAAAAATAAHADPGQSDVFISHNWGDDEQGRDNHARAGMLNELLKAEGMRTWFDAEKMSGSINDAMCDGIEQARVVLCLITEKYIAKVGGHNARDNCRKEFIHASRMKSSNNMIAVVMEPCVRSSTDWHGPVGLELGDHLYVDLADMDGSTTGADPAVQLLLTEYANAKARESAEDASSAFSVDELRAELDRMRQQLSRQGVHTPDCSSSRAAASLPASVPNVTASIRVTEVMQQVAEVVITPTAGQVGIVGMGGVGKTTLSAWVVRQDTTRCRFQAICWVPLGQTPDMDVALAVMYLQLTGRPLADGLSDAEREQMITQAFRGITALLVVDDAWDLGHARGLMKHVDPDTESKVLISSRAHAVVKGGTVFDLKPPTIEAATKMLLDAAGCSAEDQDAVPPEAVEIAAFCDRLPLMIGIAGKLLESMDIGSSGSWDGALELLQSELDSTGDSPTRVEETVIRVSLNSIAVQHRDQAAQLLAAFALVPEDTRCPLRVLGWLFEAATGDSYGLGITGPSRILRLRVLLKTLIDKSLVLGTVDRPSLHDIVADYAIAQHSAAQLAARHAAVVELFRQHRPVDGGWDRGLKSQPDASYVLDQTVFHMIGAIGGTGGAADDTKMLEWFDDAVGGRLDAVPHSAAKVLGWDLGTVHAKAAEESGHWWQAAVRWRSIGEVAPTDTERTRHDCAAKASDLLYERAISPDDPVGVLRSDVEHLATSSVVEVLRAWLPADGPVYGPRLGALAATKAAQEDFLLSFGSHVFVEYSGGAMTGDTEMGARGTMGMFNACESYLRGEFPGVVQEWKADLARVLAFLFVWTFPHETLPGFDARRMYGEGGIKLLKSAEAHDYDVHMVQVGQLFSLNPLPSLGFALTWHFCEPERCTALIDSLLSCATRWASDPRRSKFPVDATNTLLLWHMLLHLVNRDDDSLDLLAAYGMVGFADIQPVMSESCRLVPAIRNWGSQEMGAHALSAEECVYAMQTTWLMLMWDKATTDERRVELLKHTRQLPSAKDHLALQPLGFPWLWIVGQGSMVYPALLHEKMGLLDRALEYTKMVLLPGATSEQRALGGTEQHQFKVMAHTCRGRIFAKLGRREDAAAAFEAGRAVAQSVQYHGFEAVVLRDELACAVDAATKRAVEQRLAVVLQKLDATPEDLNYIRF